MLSHAAFISSDTAATADFYAGILGMELVAAVLDDKIPSTGEPIPYFHSFFRMADGSTIAFFEAPDMPFDFKEQHDYDLHTALEVDEATMRAMLKKGKDAGIETRGVSDHGFIHSIYFRDPNGYVVELCTKLPGHDEAMDPKTNGARDILDRWQAAKA